MPHYNLPESIAAAKKEELTKTYTALIVNKVVPAYQQLNDFMANEYKVAGGEAVAV